MVPLEPASRRAFWNGVAIGVAFRIFGYCMLWALCGWANRGAVAATMPGQMQPLPWVLLSTAPVVIPFIAGFVSAFFWRQTGKHTVNGIGLSVGALAFPTFWILKPGVLLILPCDALMCVAGVHQGIAFWNSRQGRQFFGDFSTRDDEEPEA